MFPDFKKSQFPEEAKSKYIDAVRAFKRQDKSDLMKHLSFPLYEVTHANTITSSRLTDLPPPSQIFKLSIKQDRQLPFQFYDEIKDIKLHMGIPSLYFFHLIYSHAISPCPARVYTAQKTGIPSQTWH